MSIQIPQKTKSFFSAWKIASVLFLLSAILIFFWLEKSPADIFSKKLQTAVVPAASQYKSISQFQMQTYDYATESYKNVPTGYKVLMVATRASTIQVADQIGNQVLECAVSAPANGKNCSFPYDDLLTFKVFLPPKANSEVTILNSQGSGGLYAVARFNGAISENYTTSQLQNLASQKIAPHRPLGIADVTGKDGVVRNSDGITSVFRGTSDSGGWLYVRVFTTGATVKVLQDYHFFGKWSDFTSFYDNYTGWQTNGDPADPFVLTAASTSPTPTSTPNSTPTITATPSPTTAIPGDIDPINNHDGDVDIFDYNIFIQYWSQSPTNNPADIDKNGKVDIFDYNLLVGNFGRRNS